MCTYTCLHRWLKSINIMNDSRYGIASPGWIKFDQHFIKNTYCAIYRFHLIRTPKLYVYFIVNIAFLFSWTWKLILRVPVGVYHGPLLLNWSSISLWKSGMFNLFWRFHGIWDTILLFLPFAAYRGFFFCFIYKAIISVGKKINEFWEISEILKILKMNSNFQKKIK